MANRKLAPPGAVSALLMKTRPPAAGCAWAIMFYWQDFAAKLNEVMEYHNFMLTQYYKKPAVDFQRTLDRMCRGCGTDQGHGV